MAAVPVLEIFKPGQASLAVIAERIDLPCNWAGDVAPAINV
jgi:hypothetical protein